jgi:hypothetical protein
VAPLPPRAVLLSLTSSVSLPESAATVTAAAAAMAHVSTTVLAASAVAAATAASVEVSAGEAAAAAPTPPPRATVLDDRDAGPAAAMDGAPLGFAGTAAVVCGTAVAAAGVTAGSDTTAAGVGATTAPSVDADAAGPTACDARRANGSRTTGPRLEASGRTGATASVVGVVA